MTAARFRTHQEALAASVTRLTELAETLDVRDCVHLHTVLGELNRLVATQITDVQMTTWDSGVLVADPTTATVATWALDVWVPGEAVQKGSTKAFAMKANNRRGMRAVVTGDNSADERGWENRVFGVVHAAWSQGHPTTAAVVVVIDVVLPRRKSAPRTWTPWHTRKPDGDKLVRAVRDALTSLVYADDAQVVAGAESKREAEPGEAPGARIRVAVLPERSKP